MPRTRRSPFPGHLRGHAYQRDTATLLLLREYDCHPAFRHDCTAVKARFDESGDERAFRCEVATLGQQWHLDQIPLVREQNYRLLVEGIRNIGGRLSLRPGDIVRGPFTTYSAAKFVSEEPEVRFQGLCWSWRVSSAESLANLRERIRRDLGLASGARLPIDLDVQLRGLLRQAEALHWSVQDVRHELERQVRWLFLRICPQPERPRGFAAIANADDADERTVRRIVQGLAEELGIELPEIPPGRPRSIAEAAN